MRLVNLEPGTDAWLIYRMSHYNASEAPVVMNCAPSWFGINTPYKLQQSKAGVTEEQSSYTEYLQAHGSNLEAAARAKVEELLDVHLDPVVVEEEVEGMSFSASLDGFGSRLANTVKVEIKCPATGKKSKTWADAANIQEYHRWQLLHQHIVIPTDESYFFVYIDEDTYWLSDNLEFDREKIEQLIAAWRVFGEGVEPDWVELDALPDGMDSHYATLDQGINALKSQKAEYKKKIEEHCKALGDKVRTPLIEVTQIERKGNVNYKKVPQLEGVDLEDYRAKSTTYTKISVK